jgi:hypothetical protein
MYVIHDVCIYEMCVCALMHACVQSLCACMHICMYVCMHFMTCVIASACTLACMHTIMTCAIAYICTRVSSVCMGDL